MRIKEEQRQRWDVESIVGRRKGRGGGIEYLVIWEGFSAAESTWEPVENLKSAREAVAAFERPKKRKQLKRGAANEGGTAAATTAAAAPPTKRRRADAANAGADPPAAPSAAEACACCMVVPDAEDGTVTPCGHVFCLSCITEWLNQHFDVDEIAPQQRCPVCRAGLRQFARQIHITNAIADAPAAVGAPRPAKKRRPSVPWSVAEAQQLQALLLAPSAEFVGALAEGTCAPRCLGQQVVETSVEWEIIASKLGTGRSSAAVRARARIMGLLVSATTADAAEAAAAAASGEAKRTPKTPEKQRPRARGGRSESAAEAHYKVLLQRIKPLWRRRAQERRCKRIKLLEQQEQQRSGAGRGLDPSNAMVPIADAGYEDEQEEGTDATDEGRPGAARWQWGGVEGVAPWLEAENSYVSKVLEPSAVEEAEWVVEAVVDKRLVFSGSSSLPQEQWEVKWWKWPCTTWEPREHLEGCAELVQRYESALQAVVTYAPFDGTTLRGVRAAMALSRAALAKSIGVKVQEVKAWEEGEMERGQDEGQVPIPFSRQHAVLQLYQASWRAARRNAMLRCGGLQLSTPHKQRLSDGKPCRGFSLIASRARPGIAAFKCLAQANHPKAAKKGGSRRSPVQVVAGLQLPLPLELVGSRSKSRKPCPVTLRLGWLLEPPPPNEPTRQWDAEWTPPRRRYSANGRQSDLPAGAGDCEDCGMVGGSCLASFAQQNGLVAGDVLLVERVKEGEEAQSNEDTLVLRVVVLWSTVDVATQRGRRRGARGEKHAAVVAAVPDVTA